LRSPVCSSKAGSVPGFMVTGSFPGLGGAATEVKCGGRSQDGGIWIYARPHPGPLPGERVKLGHAFWRSIVSNSIQRKERSSFANAARARRRWAPTQRRTRATMITISRINPRVPPPIQNTSPSIGVINALIVLFSFEENVARGQSRGHGVKPLRVAEKLGGEETPRLRKGRRKNAEV